MRDPHEPAEAEAAEEPSPLYDILGMSDEPGDEGVEGLHRMSRRVSLKVRHGEQSSRSYLKLME